ncbi:hypothetical protein C9446_05055 [Providencia heimbachae]|nr:hypothetical protein C9446_05055 [Providencia heimbachae]
MLAARSRSSHVVIYVPRVSLACCLAATRTILDIIIRHISSCCVVGFIRLLRLYTKVCNLSNLLSPPNHNSNYLEYCSLIYGVLSFLKIAFVDDFTGLRYKVSLFLKVNPKG